MLPFLFPVLFTFYIQVVLKFKKKNSGAKGLIDSNAYYVSETLVVFFHYLYFCFATSVTDPHTVQDAVVQFWYTFLYVYKFLFLPVICPSLYNSRNIRVVQISFLVVSWTTKLGCRKDVNGFQILHFLGHKHVRARTRVCTRTPAWCQFFLMKCL
jgi:hypothetical protein